MTLRRTFLAAIATSVLFAGPALADGLHKGGLPLVSNTNTVQMQNTAAGIGNHAHQAAQVTQQGPMTGWSHGAASSYKSPYKGKVSPYPGKAYTPTVNVNTTVGTNVAAGIGNTANQFLGVSQQGSPGVTSGFNAVDASNLAAGLFNKADQQVLVNQQ
ncbi:hypothetical protein [Caenispirillum salinarum]|uniref:hypothetical protein n=1 Tax=Caenispirillum salinarum TaxID=859058 RepID=UPI00384B10B6